MGAPKHAFEYEDKPYIVLDFASLCIASVRLNLIVAVIKGLRVLSHDFKQVYVQSEDKLSRKICLLPKKPHLSLIGIGDDGLLELLRPLMAFATLGTTVVLQRIIMLKRTLIC